MPFLIERRLRLYPAVPDRTLHPDYRAVCQEMWRLIRDRAGHHHLAEAMRFVDLEDHELGRLSAERRSESRRGGPGT